MDQHKITDLFTRDRRKTVLTKYQWIQLFCCSLIIGFYLLVLTTEKLERVENVFLDYFFRQRPQLEVRPEILFINIDEDSIKAIGKMPWPRNYYAEMINVLAEWNAQAVVLNVPFGTSGTFEETKALERAFQKSDEVYLPVSLEPKEEKKFWVHSLPVVLEPKSEGKVWVHAIPELNESAKGVGHVNGNPDSDGVIRRVPAFLADAGEIYPHLALLVVFDFLGAALPSPYNFSLPRDASGNFLINWFGKWNERFTHYSYSEIIRSRQSLIKGHKPSVQPEEIEGKICIIGVTAKGHSTIRVSPLEPDLPLFAIQAHIMNSVLTGQFIVPPTLAVNVSCLMIVGLMASFLFVTLRNIPALVAGILLAVLWMVISFLFFWQKGLWIYVVHPLLLILTLLVFSAIYSQFLSNKEKMRLFDLATRDGLTGLFVIRHFRDIMNQVVKEHNQSKQPLALILIDIDNFKPINDTYGHPAGDMVLKKVAQTIHSCLRSKRSIHESDFVGRYGGEEFIILVRNADLQKAAQNAGERVREAVEKTAFQWKDVFIPVTVSVGVSVLHENEKVPDAMVHRADEALYEAKRTGKNKVCTETPSA